MADTGGEGEAAPMSMIFPGSYIITKLATNCIFYIRAFSVAILSAYELRVCLSCALHVFKRCWFLHVCSVGGRVVYQCTDPIGVTGTAVYLMKTFIHCVSECSSSKLYSWCGAV